MTTPVWYDRVRETTITTGTGTITLAGAVLGYQSFGVVGNGNTCYYTLVSVDSNGNPTGNWEVGIGTYTLSGTTLTRNTVVAGSSGAGTAITLGSHTNVFLSLPAQLAMTERGFIYGLPLSWISTTTVMVGFPNKNSPTSMCVDSNGAAAISVVGGTTYTISSANVGAALGDDSFTGPGTVSTSGAVATGSSTTFTTSFGVRTCTGTITSSSTAVTGTGTKFMSEFAVNDLIGTASLGYYAITAIASDTALTIGATPGTAFTGQTPNCIEQPSISVATGGGPLPVLKIITDTSLSAVATFGTLSGKTYTIGQLCSVSGLNSPIYLYVFIASGTSGTTAYWSTQRTTPYGLTGYAISIRRIGSVRLNTSAQVVWFDQAGLSIDRTYAFEDSTTNTVALNGGTQTGWTNLGCHAWVPPTATEVIAEISSASTTDFTYLRKRAAGNTATTRPTFGASTGTQSFVSCDGAQYLDYLVSGGSGDVYIGGYVESL